MTSELDAREKSDLDATYGVVERGRRPREYAPALSALEKGQKTRAKRRHLDMVDRGLMDLVSVYRDAIAVATGAPGRLVNEEIRGDIDQIVRGSTPELNLRRIGWIFEAREQMLEFNVPVAARPGVDDGGAQGPRGEPPLKRGRGRGRRGRTARRRRRAGRAGRARLAATGPAPEGPAVAVSTTPAPGATPAAAPGAGPVLLPATRLVSRARTTFLCATLTVPLDYRRPAGDTLDLALLRVPAAGPGPPDRLAGGEPRRPGRARAPSYAAAADQAFGAPLRDAVRHRRPRPARHRRQRPRRLPLRRGARRLPRRRPRPRHGRRGARRTRPGSRRSARAASERSGALAAHVSTIEAARDLDVLRAALGESTLTYLGASYGTQLGATYAELFPDRAGRLVLDGAVDLSADSAELALEQARGFETALRSYVQNCVDSTDSCFLGDSVDEGLDRIQRVPRRGRRAPAADPSGPRPRRSATPSTGSSSRSTAGTSGSCSARPSGAAFDGDGADAAAALGRLHLARSRRRLRRQPDRGALRHQLPRRPVRDPAVGGGRAASPRSRRRRPPSAGSPPGGSPAASASRPGRPSGWARCGPPARHRSWSSAPRVTRPRR